MLVKWNIIEENSVMFTKYIDNVSIDYLYKENSNYPFSFTIKSKNKTDPKVTFYLNCNYDLYTLVHTTA